jgi:hypothetical protein
MRIPRRRVTAAAAPPSGTNERDRAWRTLCSPDGTVRGRLTYTWLLDLDWKKAEIRHFVGRD